MKNKKIILISAICLVIVLIVLSLVFDVFGLFNCDAKEFKKDYESLNGEIAAGEIKHRSVNIDSNNPFIISDAKEIVKMIENKDTFIVYFGDKQCPWCRSVIEKFIEVSKDYDIDKVYYVNIWDDDHNEILRDKYEVSYDEDDEIIFNLAKDSNNKEIKGTKEYHKLLESFDSLLSDYTLNDQDGNKVEVGEKRIFAPNFIYVEDGIAKYLVSGMSELQKDPFSKLTKKMKKDQENNFKEFFDKIKK